MTVHADPHRRRGWSVVERIFYFADTDRLEARHAAAQLSSYVAIVVVFLDKRSENKRLAYVLCIVRSVIKPGRRHTASTKMTNPRRQFSGCDCTDCVDGQPVSILNKTA